MSRKKVIPVTEEEAFGIIDKMLSFEEKQNVLEGTADDFACDEHFDLGLWIRNNWIYHYKSKDPEVEERYEKCFKMLVGEEMYCHPDSIANDFLERYYEHLKGFLRVDAPSIAIQRKPAQCPHCGAKLLRVLYGEPTPEMMKKEEAGKLILGGCCIGPDSPDYRCFGCGQGFVKE